MPIPRLLVGTAEGLHELAPEPRAHLEGHEITGLARARSGWWAITGGRTLWRASRGAAWSPVAAVDGPAATCLASTGTGVLVGTADAGLLRLDGRRLRAVEAFEHAEGRARWYTPWGDPPDTRSVAEDAAGTIYVNVHVGGVLRSADGGRSWAPTLDVETDVHQVLPDSATPGLVMVAAATGFGLSRDGGRSWRFDTEGLHAHYMRALARAGDTVFVSTSTGPGGRRSALYRRPLDGGQPFERCREGLPEWFGTNIDTACLAASRGVVALGTQDGMVFVSTVRGRRWEIVAKGLPPVRCVVVS